MSFGSQHPEYQSSARSLSKFAIIKPEHFFPQKFLSQINSPGPGGWGGGVEENDFYMLLMVLGALLVS